MNRWVKQPRADEALEQGLKGFDDRYRLYNYYLPVPHVLLSPMGLYVLTALGQDGVIRFEGEKLHRDFSLGRLFRFMAEEGIGRPFAEAAHEVQKLRQFLAAQGVGEEVEIQSMLVFYSPRAELVVSDPPLPVVNPKGIKKTIRKQQSDKLPGSQYRQLQEVFDAAVE